jgi:ABC-type multidrug transport system ATPase subunit
VGSDVTPIRLHGYPSHHGEGRANFRITSSAPCSDGRNSPPLSSITKRFGALVANDAIDLQLAKGEVVALLGENGAGKTTLMNILFGHYVADEGHIEAFGRPLPPGDPKAALQAGIGMVHQHFTLADNMSVLENIVLGTQSKWSWRLDRAGAVARIRKLSADFGLAVDPLAPVSSLAVGERQRVEILKALYRDARILILDEPTAVLTPQETDALFATLRKLVAEGLSIIFISHKLNEVMAVSERVLVLRGGRLVGERRTAETTRQELAALMVGQDVKMPEPRPASPGEPLLIFENVSTGQRSGGSRSECLVRTARRRHHRPRRSIGQRTGRDRGPDRRRRAASAGRITVSGRRSATGRREPPFRRASRASRRPSCRGHHRRHVGGRERRLGTLFGSPLQPAGRHGLVKGA